MKMEIIFIVLSVIFIVPNCDAWLYVTRGENDYWKQYTGSCSKHSTGGLRTCICDDNYNTILTNQSEIFHCSNPGELKCYHSVGKLNQAYIITETSGTREIIQTPPVDESSTVLLKSIEIWHLRVTKEYNGLWTDITTEASPLFNVHKNSSNAVYFSYNHLDIENVWNAQLLKISLNCKKGHCPICFLVKFKGNQDYTKSIERLKEAIVRSQPKTTKKPTTLPFVSTSELPSSTPSTSTKTSQTEHSSTDITSVITSSFVQPVSTSKLSSATTTTFPTMTKIAATTTKVTTPTLTVSPTKTPTATPVTISEHSTEPSPLTSSETKTPSTTSVTTTATAAIFTTITTPPTSVVSTTKTEAKTPITTFVTTTATTAKFTTCTLTTEMSLGPSTLTTSESTKQSARTPTTEISTTTIHSSILKPSKTIRVTTRFPTIKTTKISEKSSHIFPNRTTTLVASERQSSFSSSEKHLISNATKTAWLTPSPSTHFIITSSSIIVPTTPETYPRIQDAPNEGWVIFGSVVGSIGLAAIIVGIIVYRIRERNKVTNSPELTAKDSKTAREQLKLRLGYIDPKISGMEMGKYYST